MNFWKQFEGQLLEGQFRLQNYLGVGDTGATFLGQLEGREDPVLVKIVRSGSIGWERLSESWLLAKDLQHPNLVRVYASALGNLDGLRVAYAVTDYPDAKLTSVLQERPLTEEEARELLLNCSEALHYVHQKGFAHTHVQPADVVSVNEVIKLSSDHLIKAGERETDRKEKNPYAAPEAAAGNCSTAGDIWSLGITLFEALTGRLPDLADQTDAQVLGAPYSEIFRHCVAVKPSTRWTARHILISLRNGSPVSPGAAASGTLPKAAKDNQPRVRDRKPIRARYAIPIAWVLVLVGFWLASTAGRHYGAVSAESAPAMEAVPRPVPNRDERPLVYRGNERPKAAAPGPTAANATLPTASPNKVGGTWRVVVYTYAHASSAHEEAAAINRKWPGLQARVLALKGGSSQAVVLGGAMDREAARKLRERAVASGLPRDAYIQNF